MDIQAQTKSSGTWKSKLASSTKSGSLHKLLTLLENICNLTPSEILLLKTRLDNTRELASKAVQSGAEKATEPAQATPQNESETDKLILDDTLLLIEKIVARCQHVSANLLGIVQGAVEKFPDDDYASELEGEIENIRNLLDAFVCVQFAPIIPDFLSQTDDELVSTLTSLIPFFEPAQMSRPERLQYLYDARIAWNNNVRSVHSVHQVQQETLVEYKLCIQQIRETYEKVKMCSKDIPSKVQDLKGIVDAMSDLEAASTVPEEFFMVVCGETSTGKSSFLNYFLEMDILTVTTGQCTRNIWEITYGAEFELLEIVDDDAIHIDSPNKSDNEISNGGDMNDSIASSDHEYEFLDVSAEVNNLALIGKRCMLRHLPHELARWNYHLVIVEHVGKSDGNSTQMCRVRVHNTNESLNLTMDQLMFPKLSSLNKTSFKEVCTGEDAVKDKIRQILDDIKSESADSFQQGKAYRLRIPSPRLQSLPGMVVVDTPGLYSDAVSDVKVMQYVSECGAVVCLMRELSKELKHALDRWVPKVIALDAGTNPSRKFMFLQTYLDLAKTGLTEAECTFRETGVHIREYFSNFNVAWDGTHTRLSPSFMLKGVQQRLLLPGPEQEMASFCVNAIDVHYAQFATQADRACSVITQLLKTYGRQLEKKHEAIENERGACEELFMQWKKKVTDPMKGYQKSERDTWKPKLEDAIAQHIENSNFMQRAQGRMKRIVLHEINFKESNRVDYYLTRVNVKFQEFIQEEFENLFKASHKKVSDKLENELRKALKDVQKDFSTFQATVDTSCVNLASNGSSYTTMKTTALGVGAFGTAVWGGIEFGAFLTPLLGIFGMPLGVTAGVISGLAVAYTAHSRTFSSVQQIINDKEAFSDIMLVGYKVQMKSTDFAKNIVDRFWELSLDGTWDVRVENAFCELEKQLQVFQNVAKLKKEDRAELIEPLRTCSKVMFQVMRAHPILYPVWPRMLSIGIRADEFTVDTTNMLSQGSQGCVYSGTVLQKLSGEMVKCAVKIIDSSMVKRGDSIDALTRLRRNLFFEIGALTTMQHANVLTCYGVHIERASDAQWKVYIFMEMLDRTLEFILHPSPTVSLEPRDIRALALDIWFGLRHVHESGYTHQDLRLENIMQKLRADGTVERTVIADLGSARTSGIFRGTNAARVEHCGSGMKDDIHAFATILEQLVSYMRVLFRAVVQDDIAMFAHVIDAVQQGHSAQEITTILTGVVNSRASRTLHASDGLRVPRRKLRVLCLDGGGTRGIIMVEFLKALEVQLGQKMHEAFDVICGTSTGGLQSLFLVKNKATADEVDRLYSEISATLFPHHFDLRRLWRLAQLRARYDNKPLRDLCAKVFGHSNMVDADDTITGKPGNPVCFVTTKQVGAGFTTLITNLPYTRCTCVVSEEWSMSDAALATSAAPTYLEPLQKANGTRYIDGGLGANNPTRVVVNELDRFVCHDMDAEIGLVVSLGTGLKPHSTTSRWTNAGLDLLSQMCETEGTHCSMQAEFEERNLPYFRFNANLTEDTVDLAVSKPELIEKLRQQAKDAIAIATDQLDQLSATWAEITP